MFGSPAAEDDGNAMPRSYDIPQRLAQSDDAELRQT